MTEAAGHLDFVARPDGICSRCGLKLAVTRDKRFCKKCNAAIARDLTPWTAGRRFNNRTSDQRQSMSQEPGPGFDDALRALEDGRE